MFNPEIKNLQLVRGSLSYKGWLIEIGSKIENDDYQEYSYSTFSAFKTIDNEPESIEEFSLEDLINKIDKVENF